jgi:hypothetical protein
MPTPTVWIVTRRPKRAFVGVAGGLKGAEDLAAQDARERAADEGLALDTLTFWNEHGEAPEPGKKFTKASMHVASTALPEGKRERWTVTYDCAVHEVYQRITPKKSKRGKPAAEPALAQVGG